MDQFELRSMSLLNADPKEVAIPDFVEFFINDQPLSQLIDAHFKPESPVLAKFTSVLGTMELTNFDRLKVRQLLGEKTGKQEVEKLFPAAHFDQKQILDELALDKILLYCCAECGDYRCSGYFITIRQSGDSVNWELESNGNKLEFSFQKAAYNEELKNYLNELE